MYNIYRLSDMWTLFRFEDDIFRLDSLKHKNYGLLTSTLRRTHKATFNDLRSGNTVSVYFIKKRLYQTMHEPHSAQFASGEKTKIKIAGTLNISMTHARYV